MSQFFVKWFMREFQEIRLVGSRNPRPFPFHLARAIGSMPAPLPAIGRVNGGGGGGSSSSSSSSSNGNSAASRLDSVLIEFIWIQSAD